MSAENIRKPACHNCKNVKYWNNEFYCNLTDLLVDTFFICDKYFNPKKMENIC